MKFYFTALIVLTSPGSRLISAESTRSACVCVCCCCFCCHYRRVRRSYCLAGRCAENRWRWTMYWDKDMSTRSRISPTSLSGHGLDYNMTGTYYHRHCNTGLNAERSAGCLGHSSPEKLIFKIGDGLTCACSRVWNYANTRTRMHPCWRFR